MISWKYDRPPYPNLRPLAPRGGFPVKPIHGTITDPNKGFVVCPGVFSLIKPYDSRYHRREGDNEMSNELRFLAFIAQLSMTRGLFKSRLLITHSFDRRANFGEKVKKKLKGN